MTDEEYSREVMRNLKSKYPREEDESVYLYVKRLMKMVTDSLGWGLGFQKMWRYHSGDVDQKINVKGNEKLWAFAIARYIYDEDTGF